MFETKGSSNIAKIEARQIIDSRAYPTVETRVTLASGAIGVASVPSGASVGKYEACEIRDNEKDKYSGKGCICAVRNVNEIIAPALSYVRAEEQSTVDSIMIALDGTRNKSKLGANAILSVSLAVAKAAAAHYSIPDCRYLGGISSFKLPRPMMNIINGGAHARNNIDIQEFMIVPTADFDADDSVRACAEVYHALRTLLSERDLSVSVGDEGGFAPDLKSAEEGIEYIISAIRRAGYNEGKDISLALDVASSEWYNDGDGMYHLPKSGVCYSREALAEYLSDMALNYPIISIEDGMAEEDLAGWRLLGDQISKKAGDVMLVGDDLFVSNPERLKMGIKEKIANAILLKPNQIGTLSEIIRCRGIAGSAGYRAVISHRSGDTTDAYIADIGVGLGCDYIKSGAPCRGERVSKYNRLMKIGGEINKKY
jgi:enolase